MAEKRKCIKCGEFKGANAFREGRNQCRKCRNAGRLAQKHALRRRSHIEIPETKRCPTCETVKSGDEFYRNRWDASGLAGYCKECSSVKKKKQLLRLGNRKDEDIPFPESNTCGTCGKTKPRDEFSICRNRTRGLHSVCKSCQIDNRIEKKWGLSPTQYKAMSIKQGGVCAICGQPEKTKREGKLKRLAVDHNHDTGAIRELLCVHCNNGLGSFGDSIEMLELAIGYLRKHEVEGT